MSNVLCQLLQASRYLGETEGSKLQNKYKYLKILKTKEERENITKLNLFLNVSLR